MNQFICKLVTGKLCAWPVFYAADTFNIDDEKGMKRDEKINISSQLRFLLSLNVKIIRLEVIGVRLGLGPVLF